MRNFIISAASLLVIVIIWGSFFFYSSGKIKTYEAALDTIITEYVNDENWDEAKASFNELQHDWNRFKHIASFFLDSSSLNHIDSTFRKIHYYISADDKSNSSSELAYLKGQFISLHNNEALKLENIF